MKTSLVISIALFAAFSIPDISCRKICSELDAKCNEDSDCCFGKCLLLANETQKYCIDPEKTTYYGYDDVKVQQGNCSYNKSFANTGHELLFEFFGLNAAHHGYPSSTKLQLTLNNKTIDVIVNNIRPQYNSTLLELSKEAAEALNITEEGFSPCSIIIYEPEPDYSTIKNILGISTSFFVVTFLVMTFL